MFFLILQLFVFLIHAKTMKGQGKTGGNLKY